MAQASIEIHPLAGALGAEIAGVDLARTLDDATVAAIRRAWLDHLVIFFRGQDLPPAGFLAFARRLGTPMDYPFLKGLPDFPAITPVVKLEHETVNFGGLWHSDTAYLEQPPMATMLIAREIPPVGGDTLFANMYLAYETLSPGLKRLLDPLVAVNSSAKADVSKTREDRLRDGAKPGAPDIVRGGASRCPHPSRNRPQGALRQRRAHRAFQGYERGGKRAAARFPGRPPRAPGIHLPLPLANRLARVVGQSLRPAQPDQRLSRPPPRHAPRDAGRRQAALSGRAYSAATAARAGAGVASGWATISRLNIRR